MKIKKIEIENYRLLKGFSIDLEDELSLVIGKNNTGKTSLLSVMDKFLNQSDKRKFTYDDFNIDCKEKLKALIKEEDVKEEKFESFGIKLKVFIEYEGKDNLSNISKVMMDLDPDNNFVILTFEYILTFDNFIKLKNEFNECCQKKNKSEPLNTYLKQNHSDYFKLFKKSVEFNTETKKENESSFIDLDKEKILLKNIINFKYIRANREVSNKDIDTTLSLQTSKIYKKTEASDEQEEAVDKFKDKLVETDSELSDIYIGLFNSVIKKVKKFGGIKEDDSIIEIISSLQHRELLDGNTTVMYNHHGHSLPEHYNGLGYMNLISMIFEIEIIINEFTKTKDEKPADINLFFIEEPEAHTHPQMQYVFIKNIKDLLKDGIKREDGENRKLQYIISTHSSHIVAESDFNDIKYLKKATANSVVAKNLTSLEIEYTENGEEKNYRFLKQYLTLNRSELFFADKAILIEGDTERILLPAMMKKIDQENPDDPSVIDLANKLRTDGIEQKPSDDKEAPNMNSNGEVKKGSIKFVYSISKSLDDVKKFLDWDFDNSKATKELNLTHNLIAGKAGFRNLMDIYDKDKILDYRNRIKKYIKDNNIEDDFSNKAFGEVTEILQKGKTGKELNKVKPTKGMQEFIDENTKLFNEAKSYNFHNFLKIYIDKDQLLDDKKQDVDDEKKKGSKRDNLIKHLFKIQDNISLYRNKEFQKLYAYLEGYTPFSTQHKTKGAEFNNVLVVLDNAKWNKYNFENLFLENGSASVLNRTQKIFYVCCTRTIENLAVYFDNPNEPIIEKARDWFGEENVVNLDESNKHH